MEFIAKKDSLLPALDFVCSHLRSSFTNYCCVSAEDDLRIIGVDSISVAKAKIEDFTIKSKGFCYVDVFVLRNAVKHSPEEVSISVEENSLRLKSGRFTCSIPLVNEEYVFEPIKDDDKFIVNVENDALTYALKNVIYAAGRTEFDFVNVEADGQEEELRFVATDGSRLSMAFVEIDYNRDFISTVIHRDSVRVFFDYVRKSGEESTVLFIGEKGSFGFRGKNIEYVTKPVVASFPNYKRAIPKESDFVAKMSISRKKLVSALKKAMLFSSKGSESAIIEVFDQSYVAISSEGNQGSYYEKLDADTEVIKGDSFKLAVNPKFLLQTLINMKSDSIFISFSGERSGMLVTSEEDNCLSVIMPVVMTNKQ